MTCLLRLRSRLSFPRSARNRAISPAVDGSCAPGTTPGSSSGRMPPASSLPSSTPHWSKLSIPHSAALHRHLVLVQRDQPPQRGTHPGGGTGWCSTAARRRTARCGATASISAAAAPLAAISARISASDRAAQQRLGLGEGIGGQRAMRLRPVVIGLGGEDEIDRHRPRALVHQLHEAVLRVGAGLAEQDRAGVPCRSARPSSVTCLPLLSISTCWRCAGSRRSRSS